MLVLFQLLVTFGSTSKVLTFHIERNDTQKDHCIPNEKPQNTKYPIGALTSHND